MSAGGALVVRAPRAEDTSALQALFERSGSACFCRYWHFQGDKNGWQHRLAHEPALNAQEFAADLAYARDEPTGILAESSGLAVGWMKLTPAARVSKLYEQRVYRNLPCFAGDRSATFSIGCFLIDPDWRRQGVARALLREGIRVAREQGARALEAFPRRAEQQLGDAEMWMGPAALFEAEGFEAVSEFGPYPVLRRSL